MFVLTFFYVKPGSHCPGIQPQNVPVWTSGPTGTTTVGTPGSTTLNRDKSFWTGDHRVAPVVFKILIQPGLTGTETNAVLFRGDPDQHRSFSSSPPGETVVNWHGLCPRWGYGDFRFGHGVPRRRAELAATRAGQTTVGTVATGNAGKVTVDQQYGYSASRWTPIPLRKPYFNHDFLLVSNPGSTGAIYRGNVN
jgi:hypothetical protein